jgi:hypothetical protein
MMALGDLLHVLGALEQWQVVHCYLLLLLLLARTWTELTRQLQDMKCIFILVQS